MLRVWFNWCHSIWDCCLFPYHNQTKLTNREAPCWITFISIDLPRQSGSNLIQDCLLSAHILRRPPLNESRSIISRLLFKKWVSFYQVSYNIKKQIILNSILTFCATILFKIHHFSYCLTAKPRSNITNSTSFWYNIVKFSFLTLRSPKIGVARQHSG